MILLNLNYFIVLADDLSVEGCPDDIFNITERGVAPNWTDPKFTGSTLITNVIGV